MSTRPLALITGGRSGIGAALARTFASGGYDLVLVARRRDCLDQVAARAEEHGATVETLSADLATPEGLAAAAERAARGDVRLLISNAGAGGYTPLHDVTAADLDRLWKFNATAPVTLAHAVLPRCWLSVQVWPRPRSRCPSNYLRRGEIRHGGIHPHVGD